MKKKINKTLKWKNIIKSLLKFCFYLLIFCIFTFIFLVIASDLWLEGYEIAPDEFFLEPLKDFPLK